MTEIKRNSNWTNPTSIGKPILKWLLIAVLFFPFLFSCSTTQFLNSSDDKTWLIGNRIEFDKKGNDKIKGKTGLVEQLSQRYQQRPNRKLFGIPRTYFYFISLDSTNKTKLGLSADRTMRKILGEEPVFIDTILAEKTAELMTTHMQNRGYFHASVDYSIEKKDEDKKGIVTYGVKSKGLYTIDTLIYESKDSVILSHLEEISDKSFLKPGDPIDIELYEKEVSRITNYLINHGYAYFYPQYINSLEAPDSSNVDLNAQLILEILTPPKQTFHQVYTIGDIFIYPEYTPNLDDLPPPDTIINGVNFASGGKTFEVKPRSLTNSIALKTGELYRFDDLEATRRQIAALGVFTSPNIKIKIDPSTPSVLNFHIQLTTNKQKEIQYSGDISYTARNGPALSTNLIGISGGVSVRNRNLFRGAELLVTSANLGLEIAPLNLDSVINSIDLGLKADLYFPRFVEYPRVWSMLSKMSDKTKFYEKLKKNGISRVSSSFNRLRLLNNYDLNFFNLSFGHEIKLSAAKRLIVNQAGIDLLIPNIDPGSAFDMLLQSQPFLQRSFSRQFMTGFLFRDINYIYDESFLGYNSYWYFSGYFDVSGLEMMGMNYLVNQLTNKDNTWNIGGVDFSHYIKLELDGRRYWKFGLNRTLIARLNTGIVKPFYKSSDVPYIKQFYVGGQNSLRGWYARGLGPGSYLDIINKEPGNRNRFYQAADLKIEFNLEYRQFLLRPFGLFNLHGATFVDVGNIWTLQYDASRNGSQFSLSTETTGTEIRTNFLNTMAIGGGIGLRWDVSYFTFRTDFGTPIRNNYPDEDRSNTYWADFNGWGIKDIRLHLGLGYPF